MPVSRDVHGLREEIFVAVREFFVAFRRPLPLRVIAARFAKRAARFDARISDLVREDHRILALPTLRGGTHLLPRAEFEAWLEEWAFGETPQKKREALARTRQKFLETHGAAIPLDWS